MGGNYAPDTFTEAEVLQQLDAAGLRYKNGRHYILTQCPTHEDKNPSAQIYKDDWFVNCHANCGRYHITKAYPSLRTQDGGAGFRKNEGTKKKGPSPVNQREYKQYDLMEQWKKMPEIPADHEFKGIPVDVLNDLGWRWIEEKNSYFIPYFNSNKNKIPFAQWRHLSGDRRFTFLKDAKLTVYGTWNLLLAKKVFVVEGTSDAAVLDYCAVPWVALPSASSGELMKQMAVYCQEKGIELVYAGDNDEAGDKLKEALDEVMSYRVCQPPKKYKDWGDFFEAEGALAVTNYTLPELFPGAITEIGEYTDEDVKKVASIMGGGKEIKVVGSAESKEQSEEPTKLL